MDKEIVVALLALLGSVIGTFGGILLNGRLVNYRLSQLEAKVDKHNRVVERVYRLEERDAVTGEALRAIRRRLGELEEHERGRELPSHRAPQ